MGFYAVKLTEWRKSKGWTQAELAEQIGCSQSYVSQIERATDPIVPGPAVLVEIFQLSGGKVQPNDFYPLPRLQHQDAA